MKWISHPTIAFFVTHHGFGHAARASAVMAALRQRDSAINFEIYTTVPQWFFHPDLIHASDAVVGKAGYSTVAEVYYAGLPYGFITRPSFRESPVLERFIRKNMIGLPIQERELYDGSWESYIPKLLSLASQKPNHANGADQIAEFVLDILE